MSKLAVGVSLLGACAPLPSPAEGPMPVRDQHPAQLTAVHMDPAPARTLAAGEARVRLDAAYTSLWLSGNGRPGTRFEMDGEILRTSIAARVGVGGGVELFAALPFGYGSGGVLDDFVIAWHDAFGLPNQNRDQQPRNRFRVAGTLGGEDVFTVRDHAVRLYDVPLGAAVQVYGGERGPAVTLRGAIELPTGDQDDGFGNGGIDLTAGVVAGWRGSGWWLGGHAQYAWVHTADRARDNGLGYGDVTSVGAAATVEVTTGVELVAQSEWETSVLRDLDFDRVSDPQWLLWLGGRFATGPASYLELALGEDLSGFVAPDFSLWASWTMALGGGR